MVGRGWLVGLGFRVSSNSLVGNLSNVSIVVIRGVLNVLGTPIGKSNRVGSGDDSRTIGCLGSVEVGLGVVIGNSVLVGVGFILALGFNIRSRFVGRGRGGRVSWGWVSNNGVMSNGVSNHWVVGNGVSNGMVGNWVGYNSWVSYSDGVSSHSMMSNWMSNNWMMNSMGYGVGNRNKSVSNWSTVVSLVNSMSNNGTMSMIYHMGRNIRGGGSKSQTDKCGNHKS